jgi:hypothetical protein
MATTEIEFANHSRRWMCSGSLFICNRYSTAVMFNGFVIVTIALLLVALHLSMNKSVAGEFSNARYKMG